MKLERDEILAQLATLEHWEWAQGEIRRSWTFEDFKGAMQFVNAVAELAESANHHPDIDIRYNHVTLALSTHSAGGLTVQDFDSARQIDAL